MDPIKTQGYAQATGFNPGTAPNTAEQQRRQDQEFIRQYKEAKELELDQEATALARIKRNNELERQNLGEYSRRKEEYESQQDRIKLNQLQREQQAQRQVAGMNSSSNKFADALNLVTELSKTAFQAAGAIKDQLDQQTTAEATADAQRDIAMGAQNPAANASYDGNQAAALAGSTAELGAKKQDIANTTIQLEQESVATQLGRQGFIDIEATTKGRNPLYKQIYTKTVASHYGKSYGQTSLVELQQEQIDNPTKTYVVDGEEKAIGELDLTKSDTLKKVMQSRLPEFLKSRGLDEYSSLGLGDFYKNAVSSMDQVTGTVRGAEIQEQKADRMDKAKSIFQLDPTPINAKLLYTTLSQSGLSNAESRKAMAQQWSSLPEAEFRAMGDMPFGPNGKSFREQYPNEWRDVVSNRNAYIESGRRNTRFAQESADEEQLLQINADYIEDLKDGKFDADPSVLSQAADQAELEGRPKSAAALRAKIKLTQSAQYDKRFLDGLKSDVDAGILNYNAQQIADNPSLSDAAKREALNLVAQYNETAVPNDIATADKSIINTAIRNRAGVNTFTKGPADPSVKVMEKKAWMRYQKVYKQEYQRTKDPNAASQAALSDFQASFGNNPTEGDYAINGKLTGSQSGKYVNGSIIGKAYTSGVKLNEVNINVQRKGADVAFAEPDLYTGEKEELTQMLEGAKTGKIKIPATLQRVQDNSGGTMSMRQLINQRLKANGLDEIPKEVGKLADEVEQSFDPRYNKYINYKPSFVRTDIAIIGSGQDPIYHQNIPANIKDDVEFQSAVTNVAQRLGVSEGDLYAVMDFETGGSFAPNQRNAAGSGATGLIQFMPSTAKGLGTSTDALARMTRVQQMEYVEKYLRNAGVKSGMNAADLYMSVLFPAAVGKSDDFVLFGRGAMSGYTGRAYDQNRGLDKNGDGSITKAEAAASVLKNPWRQRRNMRPELAGGN